MKECAKAAGSNVAFQKLSLVIDLSEDACESDVRPSRMSLCIQLARTVAKDFFNKCVFSYLSLFVINDSRCIEISRFVRSYKEFERFFENIKFTPSGKCMLLEAIEKITCCVDIEVILGKCVCIILASVKITGYTFNSFNSAATTNSRINCVSLVGEIDIIKRLCKLTEGSFINFGPTDTLSPLILLNLHRSKISNAGIKIRSGYGIASIGIHICSCHETLHDGKVYKCSRCLSLLCKLDSFCTVCSCFIVSDDALNILRRSLTYSFSIAPCQDETCEICSNKENCVMCTQCRFKFCQSCYEIVSRYLNRCIRCEGSEHCY